MFVKTYEDDPGYPGPGTLVDADVPVIGGAGVPFAFKFPSPEENHDPNPATQAFRYWNAAAALRRGVEFWRPLVTRGKWHRGETLAVFLDKGEDLNSNYDRQSLNFYHGTLRNRSQPNVDVYAAASPDLLCHELGHAILDAINPNLWNTNSQEISAFHESFGDMSALLCSLEIPSLRKSILQDTGGYLFSNSRLSRIAEQFGAALRSQKPGEAEPDCLRNAFNAFNYDDPSRLPNHAPAATLSSDSHSFSRIFTGALFESMAGILDDIAENAGRPAVPDDLLKVTDHMKKVMVKAVDRAAVVPNYFAEVAMVMVQESAMANPSYSHILRPIFVRRGIISLLTASTMPMPPRPQTVRSGVGGVVSARTDNFIELPSSSYGLRGKLLVRTPSNPTGFIAKSALSDSRPMEPLNAELAATVYVDELFANDQVQVDPLDDRNREQVKRPRTHYLAYEEGKVRLERFSFN